MLISALRHLFLLLSFSAPAWLAPIASPEAPGADGDCEAPTITVSSMTKLKQGPWLVSGARADANPGGSASFTKAYTVSTTITGGGSLILSADYEKIATLGLALSPSFSISTTTGTSISASVTCPTNSGTNFTITWGLQYYQYSYEVQGTKTYYGWDPLMRDCNEDEIAHKDGGTFAYDMTFPAKQTGSQDGADAEVEFQCCTDTESDGVPGSPVCPAAS